MPHGLPCFVNALLFLNAVRNASNKGRLRVISNRREVAAVAVLLSTLTTQVRSVGPSVSTGMFRCILSASGSNSPFPILAAGADCPFFRGCIRTPITGHRTLVDGPRDRRSRTVGGTCSGFGGLLDNRGLGGDVYEVGNVSRSVVGNCRSVRVLGTVHSRILSARIMLVAAGSHRSTGVVFRVLGKGNIRLTDISLVGGGLFRTLPMSSTTSGTRRL